MPYTKTTWSDRQVQTPLTFTVPATIVANTPFTLTPSEGTVTQAGIPITSANLNNLETQYDQALADAKAYTDTSVGNLNSITKPLTQITPTYLNSWVDNSPGVYPSYYVKDADGTVFFYFYMKNGGTSVNTVPLNLPAGYKPQTSMTLRGYADGATGGNDIIFHITNGGEVKFLRSFTIPVGNFVLLTGSYKAGS